MGKYTTDDNRSMQLNQNNDRYYSSRGDNEVEEYVEIYEGESQMGSPFFIIDNKLVKKSTVTEVVPHWKCTIETVENPKVYTGDPSSLVRLEYIFTADIYTNFGAKFTVALPKMNPAGQYSDDEFEYTKSYNQLFIVSEDNFERVMTQQNRGESINFHPDFFEDHSRETFSNRYCLNIVQRYMNSIFSK